MPRDDLEDWERRLKALFDELDDRLEDGFGPLFSIHPSRPKRGATANKEHDGLFNVGASFTAGYGSTLGRGYSVDIDIVTLDTVPTGIRSQIEHDAYAFLADHIDLYFPNHDLEVGRDGRVMKIYGDLSFRSKR